jgi:hypothetical protein
LTSAVMDLSSWHLRQGFWLMLGAWWNGNLEIHIVDGVVRG